MRFIEAYTVALRSALKTCVGDAEHIEGDVLNGLVAERRAKCHFWHFFAELLALLEVVRLLLALRVQVLEVPPGQLRGSKKKAGFIKCSIECW